jgi:SRSO17 transposase
MADDLDEAATGRLNEYFNRIGAILGHEKRRASFAIYAMGILGEGARKSVEPIAGRACGDPDATDALHQRLLHFLNDSTWDDREVRLEAAREGLDAMTKRESVRSWIVDDTGFLKQGTHSVGVQRQYTGSAGKVTNCQVAVSLSIATPTMQLPVDFELYLPDSWTDDPERRAEARLPSEVEFKTKPQLAMEMIRRGVQSDFPRGVVLADTAYGDNIEFRRGVRTLGLDYILGVNKTTYVWRCGQSLRTYGRKVTVQQLAARARFRRVTWRDGTKKRLTGRFAFERVVPAFIDPAFEPKHREDLWLIMEWCDDKDEPTKYYLATLPRHTTKKQLVRALKERFRTEQMYREMKSELGLDHFEGRRFPGWHHHVSVALVCYAFVVAERARAFPPSAAWPCGPAAYAHAA